MLRIYKSSAGSGKTYTLVKEYLRLSLHEGDTTAYRHILAITFTNKAANEMKERILKELALLSEENADSPMLRDLRRELQLETVELKRRAASVHYHMLHHYSDIAVSTIDSFVNRLVRSFAYDLQLSSDFEVEMDGDVLLQKAVANLLQTISGDEENAITRALIDFAENRLEEGKGWNIEYSLITFARELFREAASPFIAKLHEFKLEDFSDTQKQLSALKNTFEKKVRSEALKAMDLIGANGLSGSHFYYGNTGIWGFFNKLAQFDGYTPHLKPNSYATSSAKSGKWYTAKKGQEEFCAKIDAIAPGLCERFSAIEKLVEEEMGAYILSKMLLQNIYSYMLLAEVNTHLQAHQKTEGLLHISEFQQRVGKIVSEQDAPIIYERIGERYDQILIDEFQDTSLLQWRNLVPLIENSQFRSKDSLIVGDGKQAIYRFRGGEVAQFAALPAIYGSDDDAMLKNREIAIENYGVEEIQLNKNFRSRKEVIDFNNSLYRFLQNEESFGHRHIYNESVQQQGKESDGGYVQLEFLAEQPDTAEFREQRNERLLQLIEEVRAKGFSYKDIAILSRSNRTGSEAAGYLLQHKIPVVSSESLLIHQSYAVKAILSVMQYLTDRDNPIKRAEILYFVNEDLIKHGKGEKAALLSSRFWEFENAISNILDRKFQSESLLSLRLSVLTERLTEIFGIDDSHDPFIQFFRDSVMEFSSTHGNRISEFLEWWEDKKNSLSVVFPDSLDAVRIMTIHKSKGLQFPVVIFADGDFMNRGSDSLLWHDMREWVESAIPFFPVKFKKEMEETPLREQYAAEENSNQLDLINMVYVATTRAEEALYILSAAMKTLPEKLNSATSIFTKFLQAENKWVDFQTVYKWGMETLIPLTKMQTSLSNYSVHKPEATEKRQLRYRQKVVYRRNEHREFGILLHQLLARTSDSHQLAAAVKKIAMEQALDEANRKYLEETALKILEHEALRPFFSDQYHAINERPILNGTGNGWQIPDRVIIDKKTGDYVLLDFKTGEADESHEEQIRSYAALLKNRGGKVVKALLVYSATNEIREIAI